MSLNGVFSKRLLGSSVWLAIAGAGLHTQLANAHGYTSEPPSRAYACRLGLNTGCGQPMYEPNSVGEAPKGFPSAGPADGKLASGGVRQDFALLDEQTANRWHLTSIKGGAIAFDWYYSEGHNTTGWEYFITKAGWNPNAALSREAFESTPFCKVDGHGKPARGEGVPTNGPAPEKHRCTLPADRVGHHVILGIWTISNTPAAFYNVMDVDIQADGGDPQWPQVGSITPHNDLQAGDKVKARAFISGVESEPHSVTVSIDSANEGIGANWSYKLAQRINETQSQIKSGQRDEKGNIQPVHGSNLIFANVDSGVTNYQLDIDSKPGDDAYLHLHDLKADYTLTDGKGSVDFTLMTNRKLQVTSKLFDANNNQVGHVRQQVEVGTAPVALEANSSAGKHLLKVVGVDKQGREMLQQEREVLLLEGGDAQYDFVYPQSMAAYKEGTRVLQGKTGEVFECMPFPAEGWCRIYSENANNYEPGVGSNWQDAWIKR
ncbi:N-acetylglucosamine-binding protein GbpA [Pseudomonas sp. KU43P]|uniref:N-acetylglucosamine-binding protein GbpA n=1 Tax=Pseudomonas sp. KU43P TaxID=2487887 RepID=UPI0012A90C6C|nr:N-acetylglucosamine-binding protein GbpA [Pseudomonas sp. KU43P]BBH43836.1 GlcNAc-binding protein A [Pseudomonas sp. KU43P]